MTSTHVLVVNEYTPAIVKTIYKTGQGLGPGRSALERPPQFSINSSKGPCIAAGYWLNVMDSSSRV